VGSEISTKQVAVRIILAIIVLTGLLFGTAGTLNWVEAWLYLIIQFSFSISLSVWLKKNNPELLKDRMIFLKKTAKGWDKVIILISILIFIPYIVLPGLDAVRYHWSQVSLPFKTTGFIGIFWSFVLISWVMRENKYLSRVVEIQKERGHEVVQTGPYKYVRHPMYLGLIILFFCLPLALGSFWTLIPGALLTALIIVRTHLEDRTLHEELEGYRAYAHSVRYKLIPSLW